MPNIFQALDAVSNNTYAQFHPQSGMMQSDVFAAIAAAVPPLGRQAERQVPSVRSDLVLRVLLFLTERQDRPLLLQEAGRLLGQQQLSGSLQDSDDGGLPEVYLLSKA